METITIAPKVETPILPKSNLVFSLETAMFDPQVQNSLLAEFCRQYPNLRIERSSDKKISIMAPTTPLTGSDNSEVNADLVIWNRKAKKGKVFDSSTGFTLANGAIRSPDVSWIPKEKWSKISEALKSTFTPICPDFVIEIRSKTDSLPPLQAKMQEYIANGCQLAWLLDFSRQQVHIYRADGSIEIIETFDTVLSGEAVLEGFELDLKEYKKV